MSGPGRQKVRLNDRVTLRVTSDVADEIHLHTYEKKADLSPGKTVEISFVANIAGVFEVELEKSGRQLLTLEVAP